MTWRVLSNLERGAIPHSIAASIDLDAIEIHKRKWTIFTAQNMSVVRGTKIFYPNDPGPCALLEHIAHLVHETVHVWQYEHLGIGLYDLRWLDRRYHYDLNGGDVFQSFGLEQQAAMVEDSYRVLNQLPIRWARNSPTSKLLFETVENCDELTGTRPSVNSV